MTGYRLPASTAAVGNIDDDNKNQKITHRRYLDWPLRLMTGNELLCQASGSTCRGWMPTRSGPRSLPRGRAANSSKKMRWPVRDVASLKVSNVKDGLNGDRGGPDQRAHLRRHRPRQAEGCRRSRWKRALPPPGRRATQHWYRHRHRRLGAGTTDTNIRIVVANVPAGVTFRWPGGGNEGEDGTIGDYQSDDLIDRQRGLLRQPCSPYDRPRWD